MTISFRITGSQRERACHVFHFVFLHCGLFGGKGENIWEIFRLASAEHWNRGKKQKQRGRRVEKFRLFGFQIPLPVFPFAFCPFSVVWPPKLKTWGEINAVWSLFSHKRRPLRTVYKRSFKRYFLFFQIFLQTIYLFYFPFALTRVSPTVLLIPFYLPN